MFALAPSLVLRLAAGGLLVLTLLLKVLAAMTHPVPKEMIAERAKAQMAAFLARHGMQPIPANPGSNALEEPFVVALSNGCRLFVAEAGFEGWYRDFLRNLVPLGDEYFFWFQGRNYREQPIWRTRLSGYWRALLRELGFKPHFEPIFAVGASPGCDLSAMPWQELADGVAAVAQ
ncbi:MAG: hypothetical protein J2P49_02775 [Methylocapsa sp.]|nr:hypothetical protein [Methylocapsa sp.]